MLPVEPDCSDLVLKYAVPQPTGYDTIIVVDNAPKIDVSKLDKLVSAMQKVFSTIGTIVRDGVTIPFSEEGKTKGWIFIEFETIEMANLAIQHYDGYKLDKNHYLSVSRFDDVPVYMEMQDETEEIEEMDPEADQESENLVSWLTDVRCRDQFITMRGNDVSVSWNNKAEDPDHVQEKTLWSDPEMGVKWSPMGSYLTSFHKQGIAVWGGAVWKKIMRFAHPNVKFIDFSPNEAYVVTWSSLPFTTQFGAKHNLAIWDLSSGKMMRSFPTESDELEVKSIDPTIKTDWPLCQWSFDAKYFSRITTGLQGQISVFETPGMGLINKKSIKIEKLKGSSWSPKDHVISYWTPEEGNVPARVTLIKVPTRDILRTKNLFGVLNCELYWQAQGDYLLVRVERAKTKKSTQTSLEIFRMREKDIPVDVIELPVGEDVSGVSWEPNGCRFVVLTTIDNKAFAHFFQVEQGSAVAIKTLKKMEIKGLNTCSWSPKGRFLVLAGILDMNGTLQFWDTEDMTMMSTGEHYLCTNLEWDSTGRYLTTFVASWRASSDTGYIMWSFTGQEITKQTMTQFKMFSWRPRPPTVLSALQQKVVKKNLKDFSKSFESDDAIDSKTSNAEEVQKRLAARDEYCAFMARFNASYIECKPARRELYGYDIDAVSV